MSASDKTEQPTQKRKQDERKKGNVAKSKEVSNAITLAAGVFTIFILANNGIRYLKLFIASFLKIDFTAELSSNFAGGLLKEGIYAFVKLFFPVALVVMIFGVASHVMQSGLLFSKDALKPKFSKLNPIEGLKNMFSQRSLVNLIKNTVLLIALGYIGFTFVKSNYTDILKIGNVHFPYLFYTVIALIKKLFIVAILIAVVIAVFDFAYQIYSHKQKLKMTKQEVKEEYKQMEGDPLVKSQIRQKQRQMSGQRMIQNAKEATVIITNPTHISIAIKYESGVDAAPIVIAKGADLLAKKIREIAKENDIPIIENKPLARLIYKEVDVDQEVPSDMYEAVAQVLVAVYKIKNRYNKNY